MIEVYTMYLGRLAAALMMPDTTFQLVCSACGRDWRTCPTDNVLSTDHIHVPCMTVNELTKVNVGGTTHAPLSCNP